MSRIYGQDIKDKLVSIATSDLNTMIDAIEVERSVSIPAVLNIVTNYKNNQLPELFIELQDSVVEPETLSYDIDNLTEIYTASLMIGYKDNTNDRDDLAEYYIEALTRIFINYCDEDITWMFYLGSIRTEAIAVEGFTLKACGINLEIRIN